MMRHITMWGVARDTRLSVAFPTSLKAGERGAVTGIISSTSTTPKAVWYSAHVTATTDMRIRYRAASARIFNDWATSGSILSTNLFTKQGTYLGSSQLTGVIQGCEKFAGVVLFTLVTEPVTNS